MRPLTRFESSVLGARSDDDDIVVIELARDLVCEQRLELVVGVVDQR